MKFLSLIFLCVISASATTYYVDGAAGSDANAGTSTGAAWKTIHKANQNIDAGDSCFIRAGTYSVATPYDGAGWDTTTQGIAPANSGTEGNPIVYRNYPGETVVLRGTNNKSFSMNISSDASIRSYIIIHGITSKRMNRHVRILAGTYCEIDSCVFDSAYDNSECDSLSADNKGSFIYRHSQHNWIHNSTFSNYGQLGDNTDCGIDLEIGNEDSKTDSTAYNLIENCTLFHGGHHVFGLHGNHNIARNNYIHNEGWYDNGEDTLWGYRCVYSNGVPPCNQNNLFEKNTVAYGRECRRRTQSGGGGIKISTRKNIVRRNIVCDNGLNGILFYRYYLGADTTKMDSNIIIQNSFYHNGWNIDQTKNTWDQILSHSVGYYSVSVPDYIMQHNVIKNNIFYKNRNMYADTASVASTRTPHSPVDSQIVLNNWPETVDPEWVLVDTIVDTFFTRLNFNLKSTSPCIDSAAALTTIDNDNGSGTKFKVADASYFCDGWGITGVSGDTIQFAGSASRYVISDVNYDTDTITVSSSATWVDGQGVFLIYEGVKSDLGAKEYYNSKRCTITIVR